MENNTDDVQLSALLIPQEEVGLNVVDKDKIEEATQNNNENKEERQTILRRIGRVTISIFVYLCVVLPLSYVLLIIFKTIQIQISRQNKWAQEWPVSTFVLWCLLNVAGFSFVARITEKRVNPFKCRDGTYRHIIRIMVATPLIFVVGPIRVLYSVTRRVDSLSSDSLSFISPPHSSPLYSFLFNLVFILSFFVGIQFTYLDYIALFRAAGDKFVSPSLWKSYTKRELSLIIPIVFSIVAIVAWHIYLVISHDLVIWYGLFYLLVALIIVVPTLAVIFRKTYYLHVHHYFLFGLLIPFFAFPNPISTIMMGLVSGVYVEGVARWGMVNIWHKGRTRQYDLA